MKKLYALCLCMMIAGSAHAGIFKKNSCCNPKPKCGCSAPVQETAPVEQVIEDEIVYENNATCDCDISNQLEEENYRLRTHISHNQKVIENLKSEISELESRTQPVQTYETYVIEEEVVQPNTYHRGMW